ncbi:LST8-1 [Symbiodinium microadriaticum]|nr:LST8-1 [Symbiodinium microadriaticum]
MAADIPKIGRDLSLHVSILKYEVVESGQEAQGIAKGLEVLKARVSLAKTGQHVEYILQVSMNSSSPWTLRRRFNDVAIMHEALRRRVPSLPELPSKSVVRQFSPEYLESRKNALAAYLQGLAHRRDILNCLEAQEFFGMCEHDKTLRQPSEREPKLVSEVQEAAYGITSFVYEASRGLLLLGAADCNWISRIDTKLTNIKLPWEPVAPDLPSSQMSLWKESPPNSKSYQLQFACRYSASISCVALVTGGEDGGCCLCGLSDGAVGFQKMSAPSGVSRGATLPLLKHTAAVSALAVDERVQWLFSASKDNALKVYDLVRQMMQCETQSPSPTTSMHFEEAQQRLFTGLQSGQIAVWDTSVLPLTLLCSVPDGSTAVSRVSGMDYEASTGTLFSASKELLGVWSVKSAQTGSWGRKIGTIPTANALTGVAWAPSSREILAGSATGAVVAFDVDSCVPSYAWKAHEDEITQICWVDGHRRLLTAAKDRRLRIWDFPAPGREFSPFHSPTLSTAPSISAPGRRQSAQLRGSAAGTSSTVPPRQDPPTSTSQVPPAAHGYASQAAGARAPMPANDSDDDLTGWDR